MGGFCEHVYNSVIASEAKQSSGYKARLDCFVASLLAMTLKYCPCSIVTISPNSMTPEVIARFVMAGLDPA
jgi:hypothetical protein